MTMQAYSTSPSRNLIKAEREMLKYADTIMVLGKTGIQKPMPENATDTLVFRRLVPFGSSQLANPANGYSGTPVINAAAHVIQEGVTPTADTMSYVDVSVTLQNYGCLYKFSSKTQLLYEDNIPADMQKLVGQRLGEVIELVRYGSYKAGTAVIYTNGASRSAVNTALTLNKFRSAARALSANRAMRITSILEPGADYATMPIEAGWVVFHHPDLTADIRNLPGFTPTANYGTRKTIDPNEIGACEEFRFVASPLFAPFADAGGAHGGVVKTTSGTSADVYPVIVCGDEAWGAVALRGFGAVSPTVLPATQKNHANPLGLFGFVGANTWFAAVRLNENWMVRIECGASVL